MIKIGSTDDFDELYDYKLKAIFINFASIVLNHILISVNLKIKVKFFLNLVTF